ncbi:MAG: sel1 repeat family protein [Gammaproteobacteria bacterium]|nr:sel1 repeat family protein [Pseudomonadota bacterium]QOJ20095.1 MAG: sel1 repeat family protein [Gammaproteobacteria bacterium]
MIKSLCIILCTTFFLPNAFASVTAPANATLNDDLDLKTAQALLASGDYGNAFDRYHTAAVNGRHPLAQFTLALFYQNGWGRAADRESACEWFEQAAQNNVPAAQHMTGLCFEEGVHRPVDPAAAAQWFQKAAQAGHLNSYCHLGNLLMTGNGVARNPAQALELCRPAALQGSVPAQIWMGKFYLYGDPSVRNPQEAYQWFLAAAQKQSAEAFYHLGMMLAQGLISGHDATQTRQLFEQAAALKYAPAYFQAGKHFFAAQPDAATNRLAAEHLAKAYLWISAAIQRSEDTEEILAAQLIRQQILAIMPKTWLAELDRKIAQHLQRN